MRQRYVGDELTHFVGRALRPDEDAQYELLVKILSSGSLKMGGQPPPHLELKEGSSGRRITTVGSFPIRRV
jgi:hypothetical protein